MRVRILLTLLALALPSAALAVSSVSVGAATGSAGSTVNVPVSLSNGDMLTAVQVDITFSTAQITAVGTAAKGAAIAGTDHQVDSNLVAAGRVRVLVLSNSLALIPSGVIATVPMTLDAGLALDTVVTLNVENVEMVKPDTTIVGGTNTGGTVTVGQACPVPGDLNASSNVSVSDFTLGRSALLGRATLTAQQIECGNVGPSTDICTLPTGQKHACPDPARTLDFTLSDILVIRRLALGTAIISCSSCAAPQLGETRAAWIAGDVAPRGSGSGTVDIADVVVALRMAVGLEAPTAVDLLVTDVSPAQADGADRLATGNGAVDIGDVVLLLRTAVGLERLRWPQREMDIALRAPTPRVAFAAVVTGWPAWAAGTEVLATECADTQGSGAEVAGEIVGVLCATDPQVVDGTHLATIRWTGPRVDPATLALTCTVANAAYEEAAAPATLSLR